MASDGLHMRIGNYGGLNQTDPRWGTWNLSPCSITYNTGKSTKTLGEHPRAENSFRYSVYAAFRRNSGLFISGMPVLFVARILFLTPATVKENIFGYFVFGQSQSYQARTINTRIYRFVVLEVARWRCALDVLYASQGLSNVIRFQCPFCIWL